MITLTHKLIPGPLPDKLHPHPASVAYAAGWTCWITLECANPACREHWHTPANHSTGEPCITTWGRDVLLCPHCGTTSLLFVESAPHEAQP